MAAPLNTCNTKEQRGVVWFLWAKNMALFHLFGPLKHHLSGERFADDDAVERAVRAWFRQQPKEFYAAGFQGQVFKFVWRLC
jgi:hypothetical protein